MDLGWTVVGLPLALQDWLVYVVFFVIVMLMLLSYILAFIREHIQTEIAVKTLLCGWLVYLVNTLSWQVNETCFSILAKFFITL